MSDYCFYTHDALAIAERVSIKEHIDSFAERHKKQTYVLCKPLSKEDASYEYNDALAIFSSGMKPCLINTGDDEKKIQLFR